MTQQRKRVVITGASSGIGAATAEAFAERGGAVVLAARNVAALERIAERCRAVGGEALVVPTDVTDSAAVRELAARARAFLGEIDLWFSNVGVGALGAYHRVPAEAHRRVVEANLIGHLNDAHAILPIFIEQGRGIFVNNISVGGFAAAPMAASYSATKFGLRGMSQALRGELAEHRHIHVCDLYPIIVDTPAFRQSANFTGRSVCVTGLALDPRTVAAAVISLADRPRKARAVGAPLLLMKLGQFLAPRLAALATRAVVHYGQRGAPPKPPSAGNLFQPSAHAGAIDGGFRSPALHRGLQIGAVAAGAGAALLGTFLLARRGRPNPSA